MSRPSDWRERERARDPLRSWIVQAPAGSGKTELLTQRMLGLLAAVENPEEVVAITFTRKAAAEMGHRLLKRLRDAGKPAAEEELPAHERISRDLALLALRNDRERNWNLLEQPSRLRIRTIDSLCAELARQLPILSGLGGGQQVAEDADALYRQAAARTMAAIEDDNDELQADVVRVLDRYDNQYDRLVELLTSMLGHRDQWLPHLLSIRTEEGFDRAGLEESLRYLIEAQLETARAYLPGNLLAELPAFLNYNLAHSPQDEAGVRQLLEVSGGADSSCLVLPGNAEALPLWIALIKRLLTADGSKWRAGGDGNMGFPALGSTRGEERALRKDWKDRYKDFLDTHRENDALREQLNIIRKLPSPAYDDEAWVSLESLMRILLRAASEWKLVLSETGEADFSEIAARAIQSLGEDDEPSNLALRMDYRIQHLLVDEFQDTSHSQIRLLDRLTSGWSRGDGRTLFLVGDPMQSIYRFRKAEVSLFIETFEGRLFPNISLEPLQLRVNFRSTRPLVEWVNQVFPAVMPSRSDPVMGAVCYSNSSTRPDVPDDGTVSIQILPKRDDEEEARQIVEYIGQRDTEEEIAILVRSRTHAADILAQLDSLKEDTNRFRYQAIDFNPLATTPLVQDLVSLTLALNQPADRLAWLATLRAPFAGLDLADLDALAGGNSHDIILDAISAALDDNSRQIAISDPGLQRLHRIGPVLIETVGRRGREPVRSLLESAWTRLGGPACTRNDSELEDAASYFELVEALEDRGLPIDRDTLEQSMKNLYARPDALADGKLQVMTIYAAKGLQFDTVILPGLNRGTGNDRGKLLHWFELAGEDRIVMSPMRNTADKEKQKSGGDLIQFISSIEKQRQRFEDGRLLYVATTRAVQNLCLFAAVEPGAGDKIKPSSGTLLAELWPAVQDEQLPRIRKAVQLLDEVPVSGQADRESGLSVPQEYRRLAVEWHLPEPPAGLAAAVPEPVEVSDYIEFRWAGEDARLTGNLVHRLLQLIAESGQEAWQQSGGMAGRVNWCEQQLACEGVREGKAGGIIKRVTRAVENCLTSERGRWILDSHEKSACEFAMTAVIDGQLRNIVLDRTFVADGERWIIDYKTSSHSGGNLEGFLDNEAERYREQLLRYRAAVAINESLPIRTALYFPLLDRFREV